MLLFLGLFILDTFWFGFRFGSEAKAMENRNVNLYSLNSKSVQWGHTRFGFWSQWRMIGAVWFATWVVLVNGWDSLLIYLGWAKFGPRLMIRLIGYLIRFSVAKNWGKVHKLFWFVAIFNKGWDPLWCEFSFFFFLFSIKCVVF